jgi:hypothetical protein
VSITSGKKEKEEKKARTSKNTGSGHPADPSKSSGVSINSGRKEKEEKKG